MEDRRQRIEEEIKNFPHEKENIIKYLNQLDETEWKAYLLAKQILKTSFHLLKSNGFIDWNYRNK